MGNIKFRLSNMLPNAWLYKLRGMGKATTTTSKKKQPSSTIQQQEKISSKTKQPLHSYTRKSYYFSRELATGNKRSCNSPRTNQKDTESTNSPKDTPRKSSKHKAAKRRVMLVKSSPSNKHVKSSVSAGYGCRKKPDDDQLLDISTSSPENIESSNSRISLSGSYAVVKASFDPQRDFQQSMMEMIVENNIKSSKDLEYLLACYLSVNSDEYHDLIIKVFKEIWCHLNGTK